MTDKNKRKNSLGRSKMKTIYICSKFKGDKEQNIENAKQYAKWVYSKGYLPICVHVYLEPVTGLDERKGDRQKLLELGLEMLSLCDECWVFGNISQGMQMEIDYCHENNILIKYIKMKEQHYYIEDDLLINYIEMEELSQ